MRRRNNHFLAKEVGGGFVARLTGVPGSYRLDLIFEGDGFYVTGTVTQGRKWDNMQGQYDLLRRFSPDVLRVIFDGIPTKTRKELSAGADTKGVTG